MPAQAEPSGPIVVGTTLTRLLGRPFGLDEQGRPIDHGTGKPVQGAIEWMCEYVGQRAAEENPSAPEAAAGAAREAALQRLVGMLNDAIGDPRYRITSDYLLNETNRYSYEFRLFVSEFARVISGDPDFTWHAGERTIPRSLALLAKPLGIQRTYGVLPQMTAKLVKTDIRVIDTTPGSATLEWRGAGQAELVPEAHRGAYIRYACTTYKAAFAAIPHALRGMTTATVRELRCQADGADCCEWHFTFEVDHEGSNWRALTRGAAGSAALAAVAFRATSTQRALAAAGVLVPLGIAWHRRRTSQLAERANRLGAELLEERDLAEAEYDRNDRVNSELQLANIELTQRLSELTVLHELGTAVSGTLNLDEVLDLALEAVVNHLPFERAVVMLADHETRTLNGSRTVGADEATRDALGSLSLPFDALSSPLVRGFLADEPMVFDDLAQDRLANEIDVASFIAIPLLTAGRRVGLLAVDNSATRRRLDVTTAPLLMTLGSQVAVAIDKASLYAQVEAQNRTLEGRVAERTEELEATALSLASELEESRRLRERELEYLAQVNQVVAAAGAVEAQTFDPRSLDETAARTDELGRLARTFRQMAGNVIQREETLRLELEHLRFEVDEARQARQVAAIVDTEYFRALRSQANELRRLITSE